MKKIVFMLLVLAALALGTIWLVWNQSTKPNPVVQTIEVVPTPQPSTPPPAMIPVPAPVAPPALSPSTAINQLVDSIDHEVPFTPQAPSANWDAFHEEACEEASTLMVWHYFMKTKVGTTDQVEQELSDAATWERANVGTDVSIPASDVVKMLQGHFKLDAALMQTVSVAAFKKELAQDHLIIVPAQGQFLKNPYYKQPGPRYHMLVIRGYDTSGQLITNDSGTKHGEKYLYDPDVLMNAIHDWNGGDVENGAKVAIVVTGLTK